MLINKFKKISMDKYKVYIDNKPIVLYEDVINLNLKNERKIVQM